MTDHESTIVRELQTLGSVNVALPELLDDVMSRERFDIIILKQLFSPSEGEEVAFWAARFLTIRHNLWGVLDTAIAFIGGTSKLVEAYD